MSGDGDISVAEALQQLKKRALPTNTPRPSFGRTPTWTEPPLPKIRKEEHAPLLPPRMAMVRAQTPRPATPQPAFLPPSLLAGLAGKNFMAANAFGTAAAAAGPTQGKMAAAALGGSIGEGETQVSFEIPQDKVGFLIGRVAGVINAIKVYSQAKCFVEQHTPSEDQARITMVGTPAQILKCKETINALIGETMTHYDLFIGANLPPPVALPAATGPAAVAAAPVAPTHASVAAQAASLSAALGTALPAAKPSLLPSLPTGLTTGASPGATATPMLSMPAMPNMTADDYYAQWWSQYAATQQAAGGDAGAAASGGSAEMKSGAFDKDALARLADQAAKGLIPEPVAPSPAPRATVAPSQPSAEIQQLRASMEAQQRQLMEATALASKPAAVPVSAPAPAAVPPPVVSQAPTGMMSGGFQLKSQAPTAGRGLKDNDSVMKMLQTMQGNVIQAKIENLESKQSLAANQVFVAKELKARKAAEAAQSIETTFPVQELARFDPQVDGLLSKLHGRPETIEAAGEYAIQLLTTFMPDQVVDVLYKMERIPGFSKGEIAADIGRVLAPRLREFTGTQFTSVMCSFMQFFSGDPNGRAAERSRSFFVAAATEMSTRFMEFAPHEINCCLSSLISVSFSELQFFSQVGRAALARHSSFGAVQLIALLSLLAEVRLAHLDLMNAAAQFIVPRTKEMRKVDLMRMARTFAKCSIRCDPLCQAIGNEAMGRLKKGMTDATFKVEELCELSWIFCCLQFYHEGVFKAMFDQLGEMPEVSTDTLCLVYEIHLVLDSEHKEAYEKYRMDDEEVTDLLEHYKENRKDVRRCSEKTRSDVANVLKSLVEGEVSANRRTSTGLLVDVAALRKQTSTDGFIHVEIDSAMTVIRALDQEESSQSSLLIEGPVALRRRILEKHGLVIVSLRESDWKKLDDTRDKRRYLRAQLSALESLE